MASPKISVRLEPETYANLLKLAQLERKTITELVRELIDKGLVAQQQPAGTTDQAAILKRLDVMEMHFGELLVKAVKTGASARFLSRLAVSFGSDTVSWLTEKQLADADSKAKFLKDMDAQADKYAQEFLLKAEK